MAAKAVEVHVAPAKACGLPAGYMPPRSAQLASGGDSPDKFQSLLPRRPQMVTDAGHPMAQAADIFNAAIADDIFNAAIVAHAAGMGASIRPGVQEVPLRHSSSQRSSAVRSCSEKSIESQPQLPPGSEPICSSTTLPSNAPVEVAEETTMVTQTTPPGTHPMVVATQQLRTTMQALPMTTLQPRRAISPRSTRPLPQQPLTEILPRRAPAQPIVAQSQAQLQHSPSVTSMDPEMAPDAVEKVVERIMVSNYEQSQQELLRLWDERKDASERVNASLFSNAELGSTSANLHKVTAAAVAAASAGVVTASVGTSPMPMSPLPSQAASRSSSAQRLAGPSRAADCSARSASAQSGPVRVDVILSRSGSLQTLVPSGRSVEVCAPPGSVQRQLVTPVGSPPPRTVRATLGRMQVPSMPAAANVVSACARVASSPTLFPAPVVGSGVCGGRPSPLLHLSLSSASA